MVACLLFLVAAAPVSGAGWHRAMTPHFAVSHQRIFLPPGLTMELEKMHGRLRLDMAMFSPWMSKERLKLVIYGDPKSYRQGQYHPPAWSNGISLYEKKTVVVYDQPDKKRLLEIVSHETTHLLFENYWREHGRPVPAWLNEGLAMVEEDAESSGRPEASSWQRLMIEWRDKALPINELLADNPMGNIAHADSGTVGLWYVQAYSLVAFLLRGHTRLQFKNFCDQLRDGGDLRESLWLAYRFRSVGDFERQWRRWIKARPRKRPRRP